MSLKELGLDIGDALINNSRAYIAKTAMNMMIIFIKAMRLFNKYDWSKSCTRATYPARKGY